MPTAWKKWLSSQFYISLWHSTKLSHAHLQIPKISNYVTNTSFVDWKTECNLLTCDASILRNEGISMLRHFRTNNCAKMSARQIMEICFPFFRSCHSLHSAANSASVEHSTSINIAKTFVDICHWLFSATRNSIRAQCLYCTSLMDSNVRHSWSGAICQYQLCT